MTPISCPRWVGVFSGGVIGLAVIVAGVAAQTAPAGQAALVIRIGTLPGLRFDLAEFSVRPRAAVQVVFSNYDEMLHNFVITRPGARERVVQAALALGSGAADHQFVPATADVLWSTTVVPSGQSATLGFTAPATPGLYPFVCTLPGHGVVMFGTMRVHAVPRPSVPTPVEPPPAPAGPHDAHGPAASRATVLRTFMPDTGPAAIAVQLPGGVSYVFDAGAGRFRYAWSGGFVSAPSSPERGLARVLGDVFYREAAFPLRIGATPTAPALVTFRGYSIDAAGIPEFETVVDGTTVRERVEVRDGTLVRRFLVTGSTATWFVGAGEGVTVPGATREPAGYRLVGPAAQEFVVVIDLPKVPQGPAAP